MVDNIDHSHWEHFHVIWQLLMIWQLFMIIVFIMNAVSVVGFSINWLWSSDGALRHLENQVNLLGL